MRIYKNRKRALLKSEFNSFVYFFYCFLILIVECKKNKGMGSTRL